jgi:TonB family protein
MNQAIDTSLPNEYKKNLWKAVEWSFIFINLAVFSTYTLSVFLLSLIPIPEQSADDIKKIQDQYAMLVLKVAPKKEVPVAKTATGESAEDKASAAKENMANKAGERLKGKASASAQERAASREASAASRENARNAAASQVANVGALAMLTAVGDESDDGSGEQVEDLIGQGGVQSANLGKALSSLDGLKQGGSGTGMAAGRGRRGGSGTAGAGGSVDDLLVGVGTAGSRSLARKGMIALSKPDQVVGQAAKSANRNIDAINDVIRRKQGALQHCFTIELRRDPSLSGKITVKFTVESNGHVSNANVVSSTIKSASLEQCLLRSINMFIFPPIAESEGSMTVTYPFVFAGN